MEENNEEHVHKESAKAKPNVYMYVSIGLFILLVIVSYMAFSNNGDSVGTTIDKSEVNNYMETQLTKLFAGRATVAVSSVSEEKGMYVVNMTINGDSGEEQVTTYVTKDGQYMFLQPLDLQNIPDGLDQAPQQTTEVTKTDKPKVELFIMSYCPYGLQAEKAMLPVMSLLKDDAEMSIRFVSYAMHGEEEVYENLRQYCIQEQDQNEFIKYLTCFVEKDDYNACLANVNIDEDKLKTCMDDTDTMFSISANLNNQSTWIGRYPPFNIDKTLNDLYGVQGSPTLVINGAQVNVNRSPEAYKIAVCNAFNVMPDVCSTTLSTSATAPGFSPLDAVSSSTVQANCG